MFRRYNNLEGIDRHSNNHAMLKSNHRRDTKDKNPGQHVILDRLARKDKNFLNLIRSHDIKKLAMIHKTRNLEHALNGPERIRELAQPLTHHLRDNRVIIAKKCSHESLKQQTPPNH